MNKLIAFCGLDCEKCDAYIATKNNDQALREKTAKLWSKLNNATILPEHINCEGCRMDGAKTVFCSTMCEIRRCAIGKGLESCGNCPQMDVCDKLAPVLANNREARVNLQKLVMMQTERILLRPWRDSDAEILYRWASDPEVGPRAGWPPHKSVNESREIIRTLFSGEGMWAVELKETNEPIGCVGYLTAGHSNLAIAEDECEVGYWIARPYWGRGICTEAMRLVVDYCFNVKEFSTLWGDYFPENPASGKVMEHCGFKDTGRETVCPNLVVGGDRPVKIMRLVR